MIEWHGLAVWRFTVPMFLALFKVVGFTGEVIFTNFIISKLHGLVQLIFINL
jgi:hypothetical protein